MTERNTRIRASQITSILPEDLDATNSVGSALDGYVPSYDVTTGKFIWIASGGGVTTLEELTDVLFDSGTPTDAQVLQYDADSSKWKAQTLVESYTLAFTNASLSSGKLTVTHNLGQKLVLVQVYDNNDKQIQPTEVTLTNTTTLEIDLTDFGTLTGTWSLIIKK